MDSTASFHYATGGHYITMLPADWLISTTLLPSSFYGGRCYGIQWLEWYAYVSGHTQCTL